jgi:GMP synthase-like glutamine amidotransferase
MKAVVIFRQSPIEGPAYFSTFLDQQGIPWRIVRLDQGEAVPADVSDFAGLCFMGGPMSVNDPLPWIPPVLALIRDAVAREVPVIGHCLGGQLMSKAMGGTVSKNPVKEIGWGQVTMEDSEEARRWLPGVREFQSFHWHGETFTIPEGAARIAGSAFCPNQIFVMGKHLGMQCHVEMTAELVRTWSKEWDKEMQGAPVKSTIPSVQTPAQMQADLDAGIARLHRTADVLYGKWVEGLAR